MAYRDFKDLPRRTIADKILCNNTFNIAKNPKYDGSQHGPAPMFYKFDKNTASNAKKGTGISSENKKLAKE